MLHERCITLRYTHIAQLVQITVFKNTLFFQVTLNVMQSNCYSPSVIIVTSPTGGGVGLGLGGGTEDLALQFWIRQKLFYLSGWFMGPWKDFACRLSSPGVELPTSSARHGMKCRMYEVRSLVKLRDKIYHRRKRSDVSYRTIQLKRRKV